MKTLNITYDVFDSGIKGETCMDITSADEAVSILLASNETDDRYWKILVSVDVIIRTLEELKGRKYISGSIKDIREGKEVKHEN